MIYEFWMPVVGYENEYAVSDLGRVRSIRRRITRSNGSPLSISGRILRAGITTAGYPLVVLCNGGKPVSRPVHRLVAEAFLGVPPPKHEVDHRNRVRADNRLSNLRWVTRSQNNFNRTPKDKAP